MLDPYRGNRLISCNDKAPFREKAGGQAPREPFAMYLRLLNGSLVSFVKRVGLSIACESEASVNLPDEHGLTPERAVCK